MGSDPAGTEMRGWYCNQCGAPQKDPREQFCIACGAARPVLPPRGGSAAGRKALTSYQRSNTVSAIVIIVSVGVAIAGLRVWSVHKERSEQRRLAATAAASLRRAFVADSVCQVAAAEARRLAEQRERARADSLLRTSSQRTIGGLSAADLDLVLAKVPVDSTTAPTLRVFRRERVRRWDIEQEQQARAREEKRRAEEKAQLEMDRRLAAEAKAERAAIAAAQRKADEERDFDGLVLFWNATKGTSDEYGGEITGLVENRRPRALSYVQISFNLFDRNGVQVGTAFDNTTNLDPGRKWRFRAHTLGTRFHSFKCAEVTGY